MAVMRHTTESGVTLLEFTIASLLTMTILAATFTIINNVFVANTSVQQIMGAQQSLRVGMNAVTRDVTLAGTGLPDSGIPIPNGTSSSLIARPGLGMTCGASTVGCIPTPSNVIALISPGNSVLTVAGTSTDVITIATTDQTSPTWAIVSITTNASGTVVNFSQNVRDTGTTQLFVKDLLLFNNANGSAFGCVTTVVSTTTGQVQFYASDALGINQPAAQYGTMVQTLATTGPPITFPPTTAVRAQLITYFIDNSNTTNPRLMRSVNAGTPQVMVEGIENLQFSYDLFDYTNSTETSNQASPTNLNNIRSVRVWLYGHSADKLKRTNDYAHFGLVSKINVRNATFRNRYQ